MRFMEIKEGQNPEILSIIKSFSSKKYVTVFEALQDLEEKNPEKFAANINIEYGKPPYKSILLNLAVNSEDIEIIKLLLRNKADPLQCDSRGRSALFLAQHLENPKIIELLEKNISKPSEKKRKENASPISIFNKPSKSLQKPILDEKQKLADNEEQAIEVLCSLQKRARR